MKIVFKEGKNLGFWDWTIKRKALIKEELKCVICMLEINPNNSVYKCPNCGAIGHRACFIEWSRLRGTCPICRRSILEVVV